MSFCRKFICTLATLLTLASPQAFANPNSYSLHEYGDNYHWAATIYGFFFGQDRQVIADNVTSRVSFSPFDMWGNKGDVSSLFGGRIEFGKNPWTFMLDSSFLYSNPTGRVNGLNGKTRIEFYTFDFAAFYRLYEHQFGQCKGKDKFGKGGFTKAMSWEPYIGLRYVYGDNRITLEPNAFARGNESWVHPIIGSRSVFYLTPNFNLWYRSGFGGMGTRTYSFLTEVFGSYAFTRHFSTKVGFRLLSFWGNNGSSTNRFATNLTNYGAVIGLTYRS